MAKHDVLIKGKADFSSISKEIDSLNRSVTKAFGKNGAKILDSNSVTFLQKEAQNAFTKMQKQLVNLKKEAKELDSALKAAAGNEKRQEEISKKRLLNIQQTVRAERELNAIKNTENKLQGGLPDNVTPIRKFGGMAAKQVGSAASNIPVVGGAVSMVQGAASAAGSAAEAGLGMGAVVGLGLLATAAIGAGLAISRMAAGFEVFKQGIPNLLAITGMGATPLRGGDVGKQAARLGYDQLDVLKYQEQAQHAFGTTSAKKDQNRIQNILTYSRGLNIDPSQIIESGNELRKQGGTAVAGKQLEAILEKATAVGFDKSQAPAYLAAAVGLLSDLNENGTTQTGTLLSVMAGFKGAASPEQAAKTLGGLNAAVTGSQGQANSFFQLAASRAGIGGGTLLGAQFAVRQGFNAEDETALKRRFGGTSEGRSGIQTIKDLGLTGKNNPQMLAGSILAGINRMFPGKEPGARTAKLGYVNSLTGGSTATDAVKTLDALERIKDSVNLSGADKRLIADIGKDPDTRWREEVLKRLDPSAIGTAAAQAVLKNAQFNLGEGIAPAMSTLTGALTTVDTTLKQLIDNFSGKGNTEKGTSGESYAKSIFAPQAGDMGDPLAIRATVVDAFSSFIDFFRGKDSTKTTSNTSDPTISDLKALIVEQQNITKEQQNTNREQQNTTKVVMDLYNKIVNQRTPPNASRAR